jgi:hypothetical protein
MRIEDVVLADLTDHKDQTLPQERPLNGVADMQLGSSASFVEQGQELSQVLPRTASRHSLETALTSGEVGFIKERPRVL